MADGLPSRQGVSSAGSAQAADWTVRDGQPRKNVVKGALDAKNEKLCKTIRSAVARYHEDLTSPLNPDYSLAVGR